MDVSRLEWQDSFSVGIKEVDDQHRTLVELLNQLHTAIRERRGSEVCRQTLDRLAEYTVTHFQLEERLMQASNYAGFEVHKRQHEDLLGQVTALQQKLDAGSGSISFELLHFLQVWLTSHINDSDKRFGAYFRLADHKTVYDQWTNEVKETLKQKPWWRFW